MLTAHKTPSFRGPGGEPVPGSIAEVNYLRLGGIDQWVMIRGESILNPALILLHGGPGFSETGLFRYFNAPLEKSFTVVYWDQRGAGKTFNPRATPKASMTVEQFIADLDELVDVVRERLGKDKVTLFGHSWGAALGVLYTARFPHKVAAYVGSGQVGNWRVGEELSYRYAVGEAERQGNRRALRALRAIGGAPRTAKDLMIERTWVQWLDGQLRPAALWKIGKVALASKESSIFEFPSSFRALRSTTEAMWAEVSKLNLVEAAPSLQVPVFFFLGRKDHWVPPEASLAYFDVLTAPSKKLVWFEESGHEAFMDEPDKFNAAMRDLVRPVVAS